MYQFKSKVRYSEIDEDGSQSLTSIMNYLQDCSTFQSEACGVGLRWLKEQDRAWLLSAWKIDIIRRPRFLEEITVITKPYRFQGSLGYRYFEIQDGAGNAAVRANSIWCYVQPSCMRPVRITEQDCNPYGLDEAPEWVGSRKIQIGQEGEAREPFLVRREHLDTNHHVNNGQYVSMAADYLPQGYQIGSISAEYRSQAHLGDTVVPCVLQDKERTVITLGDGEKRAYAVIAFQRGNFSQQDKRD